MPLLRSPSRRSFASSDNAAIAEFLGLNAGGVAVNRDSVCSLSSVFRALSILYGLVGATPLHMRDTVSKARIVDPLMEDPHPDLTINEVLGWQVPQRMWYGNAYYQKIHDDAGQVKWLFPLPASHVEPFAGGKDFRTVENPTGKMFWVTRDSGGRIPLSSKTIMHVPHMMWYDGLKGVAPLQMARKAVELGLNLEDYGNKFFGNGTIMSGLLSTDLNLEPEQVADAKAAWRDQYSGMENAHTIPILANGMTFQQLEMPNDDAQFLESRNFTVSEMGRFLGIPPFLLMQTEKSTSWGTGLEQQLMGFIKIDLGPGWLDPFEARWKKELTPPNQTPKFQYGALLRGDSQARAQFYQTMVAQGIMTPNEVRDLEDLPPIAGGDELRVPMNTIPGSQAEGGQDE